MLQNMCKLQVMFTNTIILLIGTFDPEYKFIY